MLFIGVAFGFFGEMLNVDPHISGAKITFIAFAMAAVLAIIATWMNPPILVGFNAMAMALLVLIATNYVLPRFETTDTMRPWRDRAAIHNSRRSNRFHVSAFAMDGVRNAVLPVQQGAGCLV